jgi:hypothetical protein
MAAHGAAPLGGSCRAKEFFGIFLFIRVYPHADAWRLSRTGLARCLLNLLVPLHLAIANMDYSPGVHRDVVFVGY